MSARSVAILIGLVFVAVGILGFIDNPIVGDSPDAIFHADTVHNIVHIVSGVLFLFVALALPAAARGFLVTFGIIYLVIGIVGLTSIGTEGMGTVLGFLHVNGADNYRHVGLGLVILLMGFMSRKIQG
ncbi:MAG TPA: DUF4383 domain-containing protein, partial [Chitinophagaceae bacterium]|nr:DUF4383 domain-containing protein [Chitinophagaceae bacterium]